MWIPRYHCILNNHPKGFAHKVSKSVKRVGTLCASGEAAHKVCAAALCLILLVSVVKGRTGLPFASSGDNVKTKSSSVGPLKDVFISNHPVSVKVFLRLSLHILGWNQGRGRCSKRGWGSGGAFLCIVSSRLRLLCPEQFVRFRCTDISDKLNRLKLGGKDVLARQFFRRVNNRVFWNRTLSLRYIADYNVALQSGCPTSINTNNINIPIRRVLSIWSEYNALGYDISSILKLTSVAILPPLYRAENNDGKSQDTQNYLGAMIKPPGKTLLGYAFIILGLVINYFGYCALYKGWYRFSHGLHRGRLGLCVGLLFIAASALVLGHGFYLII